MCFLGVVSVGFVFVVVVFIVIFELETLVIVEDVLFFPGAEEAEEDADKSEGDKGHGEDLSHAEGADEVVDLVFFEEFDDKAH